MSRTTIRISWSRCRKEGYSDRRGGNVLDNASASNLLDRKKGNRRQPRFRHDLYAISHSNIRTSIHLLTVSGYEEGCLRGANLFNNLHHLRPLSCPNTCPNVGCHWTFSSGCGLRSSDCKYLVRESGRSVSRGGSSDSSRAGDRRGDRGGPAAPPTKISLSPDRTGSTRGVTKGCQL